MKNNEPGSTDYYLVEKVIRFKYAKVSKYHFQRIFSRWAGISPKKFLQYITINHAKRLLSESMPILDTAYEVGLSSPSRLHDLFVTFEAITPGEYKKRGREVEVVYGFHATPFGECLMGVTKRGICWLSFLRDNREEALKELKALWIGSEFTENGKLVAPVVKRVFTPSDTIPDPPLNLYLKGTNFQIKVWEALINIPFGCVASYADIARRLNNPAAVRAVGRATGQNPIAYIIPCHRVIRETGSLAHYRWGEPRKKIILAWEAARMEYRGRKDIAR
jgi:AraC family transcriptional regulator of adaptative response/methylated-DNA-[protein]-cysteine methyltransferase